MSKKKMQQFVNDMLDDGMIGDFTRGEISMPGSDDNEEWLMITSILMESLAEMQVNVMERIRN